MGGLRVLLAISVVIAHSGSFFGFKFVGGMVAVEVFFIISGFYMTMILDKKYVGEGSYLLFISNRFLRLYPIYWVVVLLTIIVSIILYDTDGQWNALHYWVGHGADLPIQAALFQVFSNLILFGQDVAMFLGVDTETGELFFASNFRKTDPMMWRFLFVPQAWTLGLELTFYLLAPFIVRRNLFVVFFLIGISMAIRLFTYYCLGFNHDPWTYRFFPSELSLFLLGTVAYKNYQSWLKKPFFNRRNQLMAVILLFLIVVFYEFIPAFIYGGHIKNWMIYSVVCLLLPFVFEFTRLSSKDNAIGELSYPIYLSHILVIICISPFLFHSNMASYKGEISIIVTILVSYVLVKTIAEPIEKIRKSRVINKG